MNESKLPENVVYCEETETFDVTLSNGDIVAYRTKKGALNRAVKEGCSVVSSEVPRTPLNLFISGEAKRQNRKIREMATHLSMSERQVYQRLSGEIDWRVTELHKLSKFFGMEIAKFVDLALRTRRLKNRPQLQRPWEDKKQG